MSTLFLFIGGLGGWEVILIVTLVVVLFGAKKIPELARGLGTGIREFKSATTEVLEEKEKTKKPDDRKEEAKNSEEVKAEEEVKTESELHEKPIDEDTPVRHP